MSGDRPSRRKVLSGVIGTACGLSIASGAAGAETSIEKTYYEDSANPAVTLRSDSPISLEKIAETRFEFLEKFNYRGNSEQVVFSYPRRDDIVAYNLVMDDAPREYIGHQKKNTNRRLSEDGAEVHANADKHLQKFKDADYSTQLTSNEDFNDWERVGSFYEEDEETTGNLLLEATCYRKHEASENYKNDAYAIVSEGEIGGSETGNVGTGIHNNELKIKHNWARNADMDDRYPQSMTTGEKTEGASFEVNISWPPGINVGGSSEYTQNDVRTLDESSPWFDYGEWRVEIDNHHTEKYTAHSKPTSVADVDRTECVEPSYSPPVQPVCSVEVTGEWKRWGDTHDRTLSTSFADSAYHC